MRPPPVDVLYLVPLKSKRFVIVAVVAEAFVTEIRPASMPVEAVILVEETSVAKNVAIVPLGLRNSVEEARPIGETVKKFWRVLDSIVSKLLVWLVNPVICRVVVVTAVEKIWSVDDGRDVPMPTRPDCRITAKGLPLTLSKSKAYPENWSCDRSADPAFK